MYDGLRDVGWVEYGVERSAKDGYLSQRTRQPCLQYLPNRQS